MRTFPKFGLFDGKSSSRNGGQLVMSAPVRSKFQSVDLETGKLSTDFGLEGSLVAIVLEDTPKFEKWTDIALLISSAPDMFRQLDNTITCLQVIARGEIVPPALLQVTIDEALASIPKELRGE